MGYYPRVLSENEWYRFKQQERLRLRTRSFLCGVAAVVIIFPLLVLLTVVSPSTMLPGREYLHFLWIMPLTLLVVWGVMRGVERLGIDYEVTFYDYLDYLDWHRRCANDDAIRHRRIAETKERIERARAGEIEKSPSLFGALDSFLGALQQGLASLDEERDRLERLREESPEQWRREVARDPLFTAWAEQEMQREQRLLGEEAKLRKLGAATGRDAADEWVSKYLALYHAEQKIKELYPDPADHADMVDQLRREWLEGES